MLVNKKLLQEHKRENHAYNYTVELLYTILWWLFYCGTVVVRAP